MSDQPATPKSPRSASRACCAWKVAAALLLLRLCVGWHFFSEGIKKVSYDQSRDSWSIQVPTEFLFQQAKGPLAGLFHAFIPGEHSWRKTLAAAQELTPASGDQLADWVTGYVKRRQQEIKSGKHTEVAVPEFAPYSAWYKQIDADRREILRRFILVVGLTDEQREQAAEVFQRHHRQLADYLAGESVDMQAYQHQLWRLEVSRETPEAEEVPYEQERIAVKTMETDRAPYPWVAAVKQYDRQFVEELRSLLSEEQRRSALGDAVTKALTTAKEARLEQMNLAVTCLTIGVGVCLLVGLLTRLAAVVGALFLLSVMATQPPWVSGAETMYFYYQLVEFAALLLLAAAAAGRVAGLDFILHGLWSKCCGAKGA